MKTYASIALVLALGAFNGFGTPSTNPDMLPAGVINFPGTAISNVLEIYNVLLGKKLIIDSHVKKLPTRITLKNERALTKEEAIGFIEDALVAQAAVVITPLDENRTSVTYNDALPIVSNPAAESTFTNALPQTQISVPLMQQFRVDTNSFFSNLKRRMKPTSERSDLDLLKQYFKQQGINVSAPFKLLYRPETGNLLIGPRQEDWDKLMLVMTEIQSAK